MNPFLKLGILIAISLVAFKIAGFWPGIVCLAIVLYRALKILGITRSPSIFKGSFIEGVSFTKDYIGPYSESHKAFEEAQSLIKNFKLESYQVIGIYYDKPGSVDENKMRSSIGIYRSNRGLFAEKISDELERYCNEKGYNYNVLPNCTSLFSSWEFSTIFTLMIGIKKFYALLDKSLKDAVFRRNYRVKEEEIKVTIELYANDHTLQFYVPILNVSKFLIFKKDK